MKRLETLFAGSPAIAEDNIAFLEDLYQRFLRDPELVDSSWRDKFRALQENDNARVPPTPVTETRGETALRKQAAVDQLIFHYRTRGHQAADNNPLGSVPVTPPQDLDPAHYGLTETDLDQSFYVDILQHSRRLPLREILSLLRQTYCGSVGAEYMYIVDSELRQWIQSRLENTRSHALPDPDSQRALLKALTAAEGIEKFLHRKYAGQKRFSLEGAESLIPLLDEALERACEQGLRELVIGMAHRGRLNVLVNILGKKPSSLFQEFESGTPTSPLATAGDVKYHMGFSANIETGGGPVHIAVAFNPSHLEIIAPVAEGSVRARQDRYPGDGEDAVMAILIHGDAAFAGQGVVMETLNMSETRAFTTGGTIHVVVNNQIGFTTSNPFDARSTLYCTDVAKMIQAPVFHVNGDDPEAVLFITRLAVDYRMKFRRDVVIDLICYRRHGHNEADEPAVTQPVMYQLIRQHPPVRQRYADKLAAEGVIGVNDAQEWMEAYQTSLIRDESRPHVRPENLYPKPTWVPYMGKDWRTPYDSSLPAETIAALSESLWQLPAEFMLHDRTAAIMKNRRRMASGDIPVDWGFAESLAYGGLLEQGYSVRISGQDVGRGTFFHRHAILHDQTTGAICTPLHNLPNGGERFQIYDSLLSEEGVLGFEYGYASSAPEALVVWEAQFGDFANNAQVVIDQFITSGEHKWGRLCGLVLLLPHGYEGQGPEHSSARIERYLQMCAEQNIQVCIPTTPAQIFHLLRRQMLRAYRKPLIVLTPKSLLRHKLAVSGLPELTTGHYFPLIDDLDGLEADKVTRVVLCAGKVYYDLLEARRAAGSQHIALIRIEQLYPFPEEEFRSTLARYSQLREVIWCQEEPENQGAWLQIRPRLRALWEKGAQIRYAGRAMSASPAVGQFHRHIQEQKQLIEEALFS